MNAMTPFVVEFRSAYSQLDAMQRRFVDGYVADLEIIAERSGQRLLAVINQPLPFELDRRAVTVLASPLVRAAIVERVRELSALADISIYRTLKEVSGVAYSNIANYFDINNVTGEPAINLNKVSPEQMAAIKSIEIEDKPRGGRKIRFTLHDKMNALNLVMRYQGLLNDESDHWRKSEQAALPAGSQGLPATADDREAAQLYSRAING
jgi:hypothetical protein